MEAELDGFSLRHYQEIDSTNSEAMRLALSGVNDHLWVTSDIQTHGRGRQGRNWISQAGNLQASLFLQPDCKLQKASQLSFLAGLSCYETIQSTCPEEIGRELLLKWPNDILLKGEKLSGMLVESSKLPKNSALAVIIGIGINISWKPEIENYPTTCLADHNITVNAKEIFDILAKNTKKWLNIWESENGFNVILDSWAKYSHNIGDRIDVRQGQHLFSGNFHGLAEDGSLLMRLPSGNIKSINVGDVSIINSTGEQN